ncbi:sulfatase-like hydrolase/transferase [Kordia sp.]|uniref:sulfatase-like hydrolase/transferase n=1 Tax=Kordia sp. TaxID=1965332 RepID=UPI003B5B916E
MLSRLEKSILNYINNQKQYPVIAAIAAGLYSLIYTYDSNFTLVNSVSQFFVIVGIYIVIPVIVFVVSKQIVDRISFLKKYQTYLIPMLNASFFAFFLAGRIYGFHQRKILLLCIVVSVLIAMLLRKHYKKIIVLQYIVAIVAFVSLLPLLINFFTHSNQWMEQPDHISEVQFKTHPNIYVLQPDGYVNFSELGKGYYKHENSGFVRYLQEKNFKLYDDYRSNYASTILSNSSLFAMKHHYIKKDESRSGIFGARKIAAGENPIIPILKKNDYKTFLVLEYPYLLLNRPTILYDECNITDNEIPWLGMGAFKHQKELIKPLEETIQNNKATHNFYFVEKIAPSHIATQKRFSTGIDGERQIYLDKLEKANEWLVEIINMITENDPNSLIVITADHGGYVGMEYTKQIETKLTDRDLVYSAFSSALAIKWPNNTAPSYDKQLKTPVNLFRVLFTYLSEDETLLKHLEEDTSYSVVKKDAPTGIYKYIDKDGNVVFKKLED